MNTPATSNSADYSGEQIAYKDSTYELVSKVAFLIGVPQRIFENEHEAPQSATPSLSLPFFPAGKAHIPNLALLSQHAATSA